MRPSHPNHQQVARSERTAVVMVAVLFLVTSAWFGWERVFFDGVSWLFPSRSTGDEVVLVEIDERSLESVGAWPWPRQHLAGVVKQLRAARPSVIGFALPLHAPDPVADHQSRLQRPSASPPAYHGPDQALAAALLGLEVVLGVDAGPTDAQPLSNDLKVAGGLGYAVFDPATAWIDLANGQGQPAPLAARRPLSLLERAASGVGPIGAWADADARVRREMLWWPLEGGLAVPSFALQVAALASPARRRSALAPAVLEGEIRSAVPAQYRSRGGDEGDIPRYSAADVMAGTVPAEYFAGRVVLIGLTAPRVADEVVLVGRGAVPQVLAQAYAVNSLLEGDYLHVPEWAAAARLGALALVALLLVWLFPRLGSWAAAGLALVTAMGLMHAQLMLHAQQGLWVPLLWPALAMVVGTGVLLWLRRLRRAGGALRQRLDHTEREFGKVLHAQGRLDEAFERYQRCTPDVDLFERLYTLGQEYERRHAYAHAADVFRLIAAHDPEYGDVAQHIRRNRRKAGVIARRTETGGGGTVGPYRIEREIGRGAMGAVYLALDRRSRRHVALKTLTFTGESEASRIDEVRTRFFREAEAAGRLTHPNIVAVHEVGEERKVAYIAMDYLEGSSLQRYTEQAQLLPLTTVFDLVIQVADALGYAHGEGVVHRDIKPANILYNAKSGDVKVTDFGVASLTGAGNTRTGTILGSPSYMSPEQLAGARVDGRADLFSLGVTFYQLLTGELPFAGDSLPNIMYRITHDAHPDVRARRPDLPSCASKILNKILNKDPDRRYPDGRYLSQMLRKCRAHLREEDTTCTQKVCG